LKLSDLIRRLPRESRVTGDGGDALIERIVIDSHEAGPGALYVALRGERMDGHDFVPEAVARGAAAVVVEFDGEALPLAVPTVAVEDTRRALATLAAALYDDPSLTLDIVGVTGTNGKTTTTRMIASIFDAAGIPCGTIGTVGAAFAGCTWQLVHTTPLPHELQKLLARMRDSGARAVAMEVSSHALALERVAEVRFRCAVLTNVTRDHLDFHGTREAYAAAKRRLFEMAETAIVNLDDEYGSLWAAELRDRVPTLTYGLRTQADVMASNVRLRANGSSFVAGETEFALKLPGRFNVANALAAIGVARLHGIDDVTSAAGLRGLERVPGRMEHLGGGGGVDVVVDYAHTPDALEQVLRALREGAHGAVTVVFGCGGDRDRGKRPEMGRIAAALADRVYVTSDNPRSEEPLTIIAEIEAGIGGREHVVEVDRRVAIERAVLEARPGDIVLVAGKGHETHQIIGDRVLPFDDASVARAALEQRESP
jgi:UDP-N-acetylmuramoyl-L-alanyl-D-glutamate--2,6-diaminopimelate ligase